MLLNYIRTDLHFKEVSFLTKLVPLFDAELQAACVVLPGGVCG